MKCLDVAIRPLYPLRTETLEAISIAKHLLNKVGDQLDHAVQD
jgi:hypothetical protein